MFSEAPKGNLVLKRILFDVRLFLATFCRFLFLATLACVNEIHQNVNDLVFRDRVE